MNITKCPYIKNDAAIYTFKAIHNFYIHISSEIRVGLSRYVWSQEQEMDKLGLRLANWDGRAYRDLFPPQHLLLNLLNERSMFWANGMQHYSRTRRGGLCIYDIDAMRSHSQSCWTVFPRCPASDTKMVTASTSPCRLHPDTDSQHVIFV